MFILLATILLSKKNSTPLQSRTSSKDAGAASTGQGSQFRAGIARLLPVIGWEQEGAGEDLLDLKAFKDFDTSKALSFSEKSVLSSKPIDLETARYIIPFIKLLSYQKNDTPLPDFLPNKVIRKLDNLSLQLDLKDLKWNMKSDLCQQMLMGDSSILL